MSNGPIWARSEPGERRASLTREQIASAAVALADAEGPKALSMRRLAQELGVGTMTLYGYIKTKQELLELVDDTIMAELLIPEDEYPDGDWRAALGLIATRSKDNFRRHPWVMQAMGGAGNRVGPNGLRHFEQTVRAVSALDLTALEKLDITSLVDEYAFGFALRVAFDDDAADPNAWEEIRTYVEEQLDTGEFPHIESLFPDKAARDATWREYAEMELDDSRFERGLRRLLDGIEADLRRRGVL